MDKENLKRKKNDRNKEKEKEENMVVGGKQRRDRNAHEQILNQERIQKKKIERWNDRMKKKRKEREMKKGSKDDEKPNRQKNRERE